MCGFFCSVYLRPLFLPTLAFTGLTAFGMCTDLHWTFYLHLNWWQTFAFCFCFFPVLFMANTQIFRDIHVTWPTPLCPFYTQAVCGLCSVNAGSWTLWVRGWRSAPSARWASLPPVSLRSTWPLTLVESAPYASTRWTMKWSSITSSNTSTCAARRLQSWCRRRRGRTSRVAAVERLSKRLALSLLSNVCLKDSFSIKHLFKRFALPVLSNVCPRDLLFLCHQTFVQETHSLSAVKHLSKRLALSLPSNICSRDLLFLCHQTFAQETQLFLCYQTFVQETHSFPAVKRLSKILSLCCLASHSMLAPTQNVLSHLFRFILSGKAVVWFY